MNKLFMIIILMFFTINGYAEINIKCDYLGNIDDIKGLLFEGKRYKKKNASGTVCFYLKEKNYINIKNGLADGKVYIAHPLINIKGTYIAGKVDNVIVKEYYDNGIIRVESSYKNGILNGSHKEYYADGKIKKESNYKNGILDGQGRMYYENGKLQNKIEFKNDMVDGVFIAYHENGKVYIRGKFKQGNSIEGAKIYNSKSKLIASANFTNNRIVSIICVNGKEIKEQENLDFFDQEYIENFCK